MSVLAVLPRLGFLCFMAWLLAGPPALAQDADTITLGRALRVLSPAAAFPQHAPSSEVTLPDVGRDLPSDAGAVRWYRLEVEAPALERRSGLVVYLPRVCGNPVIDFNGERLLGDATLPGPGGCREHMLLPLPRTLWREGSNLLDIRVDGLSRSHVSDIDRVAGLSQARIGPGHVLGATRQVELVRDAMLPQLIGGGMAMLGLMTLTVGWLNTRKSYLLWFGLLAVGWGVLVAGPQLLPAALPITMMEWLLVASMPLLAAAAVLFLMRYAGLVSRQVEAALFGQCLVVPASLMIAGEARLFALSGSWYLLLAGEVALAAAAALRVAWRVRRREFWIMLGMLGLMAITIGSLLARQWGLPLQTPDTLAQLALPLGLTALGARLVYLEVTSLRMAEASSRSMMERRVVEATLEAERKAAVQADQRVEQVTERERKRIAADLHDDLGAKLLTIVHTSESDRISTLAREALEEMRLSVRGLTGRPVQLTDALGDWRAEVVSRLGQANIGATWQSPNEELEHTLPARSYVQTTRILREAVSNIIKHSGASRCSVTSSVRDADFVLTIQDNGKGIPMELDGKLDRGHGMTSMKQRAKGLQGQCLVESGPGFGTVIRLTVPL